MNKTEADSLLMSRGWLSRQPENFQHALLRKARMVAFARHDHVYSAGDSTGGIYAVVDGGFAVEITTPYAVPRLCHIARSGMWFGTFPVLTGQARVFTFRACQSSSALHVPLPALNELGAEDASAFRRIGGLADENTRLAAHVVSDLLLRLPDRRIAAVLLRICGVTVGDPVTPPYTAQVTQSELGELANVSRELVNRVLNRLKGKGLIAVGYNRVEILVPDALQTFAYEPCERD